jgi:hypothetical protein
MRFHEVARRRLTPALFVDPSQRRAFEQVGDGTSVSSAIDALRGAGEFSAAAILSLVSVDFADRPYEERDIDEVVTQLVRAATADALRNLERDLRAGTLTPDVVVSMVRDVKERLAQLETAERDGALGELIAWLDQRDLVR